MFERFQHHRPMISGVCAWMADRSAVPVWIIRVVALALTVVHTPLMVIGYFVGAYMLRRQTRVAADGWRAGDGSVPDRFAHLDRRVARMEEAAWREDLRGRR